jgi:hypothetical protein
LKNDVNQPLESNKKKNVEKKIVFSLLASLRSMTKLAGSGARSGCISKRHGSPDPDPYQNVTDPQHCLSVLNLFLLEAHAISGNFSVIFTVLGTMCSFWPRQRLGDRCPAALFSIETSVQLLNHFLFNLMRGKSNLNRIILIRTFFFSLNTNNGYRESVFLWFLYGTVLGKNPCKIFCKRL